MELTIIKTEEFYDVLKYWWESHDFKPVDINAVPEHVFVAHNGKEPLYSMFLYETNSKLCWIGWQLANPDASKEDREGGLDFLIKQVTTYATKIGYKYCFTTSPVEVVQASLLKNGYVGADLQVNQYFKVL